ncbi:hypothetical protein AG1IA_09784 [Rhizoctonia solani AG-1 IA]|uniref:Uncharacterized protein n=1 Tax=Thanatephorus cucumeris (strain AG1-IA) TaxID=983506 RepID=L8WDC6_THACA|nr:hypothetical protein AG1IA_09784 [Rhizoctonia solani AG-1 IA]
MSQPSNTLSIEQCLKTLQRLEIQGLAIEEHDELVANALAALSDSNEVAKFKESIKESARLAKEIDDVFNQQAQILLGLIVFGLWHSIRWRDCLRFSCQVALDTAEILKPQVEAIKSDEDRLKAIAAIEPFITELEQNDKSAEMSRKFLDLKRDVAAFGEKYTLSATAVASIPLTNDIKAKLCICFELFFLRFLLKSWVRQIKRVQSAFGGIVGGSASRVISSLQAYRQALEKIEALRKVTQVTTGINSLVADQPSSLSFEAPNINLMLENLLTFAEIWSSPKRSILRTPEGGLGSSHKFSGFLFTLSDSSTNVIRRGSKRKSNWRGKSVLHCRRA